MTGWSSTVELAGSDANWQDNFAKMVEQHSWSQEIQPVVDKISKGERLNLDDGLLLYNHLDVFEVGLLATCSKKSRFGNNVFFNSNVHINQTNVCVLACKFCAFSRTKRSKDAYSLSIDQYIEELEKYSTVVDEVHSVGGLHPDWDVDYYCQLFSTIKQKFPHISIKALTAVEIKHLSKVSKIPHNGYIYNINV